MAGYAWPGDGLAPLSAACSASEFQLLDREPLEVELDPAGGVEFPDFIVYLNRVPLVSERLRQALDREGIDNLFYKPVALIQPELGLRESFWLALPPRIDCLDWRECDLREVSGARAPTWAKTWRVEKIAIDEDKVGRYRIFKLPPNTENLEIVVDRKLKTALERGRFENLNFYHLNAERV